MVHDNGCRCQRRISAAVVRKTSVRVSRVQGDKRSTDRHPRSLSLRFLSLGGRNAGRVFRYPEAGKVTGP